MKAVTKDRAAEISEIEQLIDAFHLRGDVSHPDVAPMVAGLRHQLKALKSEPDTIDPLLAAAEAGDLQFVTKSLAEKGSIDPRNEYGATPLLLAIKMQHVEIARALEHFPPDLGRYPYPAWRK